MTKFHEDRAKIVDFLLITNFWASTIFYWTHFISELEKSYFFIYHKIQLTQCDIIRSSWIWIAIYQDFHMRYHLFQNSLWFLIHMAKLSKQDWKTFQSLKAAQVWWTAMQGNAGQCSRAKKEKKNFNTQHKTKRQIQQQQKRRLEGCAKAGAALKTSFWALLKQSFLNTLTGHTPISIS